MATNFNQQLISELPTACDLNAVLMLAPSVHPTGPFGNCSIAGAASFENLFLVNGVTVNENVRGTAYDFYIEDAVQRRRWPRPASRPSTAASPVASPTSSPSRAATGSAAVPRHAQQRSVAPADAVRGIGGGRRRRRPRPAHGQFAAFNPFTTTPVQSVNWDPSPTFGQAVSRFAYTTPQSMRVSFGVRF